MVELLHHAGSRGIAPQYVARLLSRAAAAAGLAQPLAQPLIEPLSQRELEVLRLLADGHTNQQIAAALVVSIGTVKRHLSNIYGKLNVETRTRCVARARALNLL